MKEKNISTISDYICKIKEITQNFNNNNLICFRGEPEDYVATKLMPSLFRESNPSVVEKNIDFLMTDYSLVTDDDSNINKAIKAQHYLAKSRLLDVSFDSLVALYFSCSDVLDYAKNNNINQFDANDLLKIKDVAFKDGYVYIFNFPKFYFPSHKKVKETFDYIAKRNIYNKELIDKEYGDYYGPYYKNFMVLEHDESNARIIKQSGGFIMFPGEITSVIDKIYYKSILIPGKLKVELLNDLNKFFNINSFTLFGENDDITKLIKSRIYKSDNEKIMLSNYLEIEEFFNRIEYELKIKKDSKCNDSDLRRFLRKEKDDITNYYESFIENDEKTGNKSDIFKKINDKFSLLINVYLGGD